MLRENSTIKFLNIDGIAIGDDGATNIADALEINETLLELHMARDRKDRFDTVRTCGVLFVYLLVWCLPSLLSVLCGE